MKIASNTLKGFLIHFLIIITLVVGGVLLFFNVYLPNYTNHGESITVPDLEGIHMDEIEDFLVKRNLRYEVNDSTYTEKYDPLTIVKQYPKAGARVKENRKIFISVNRVKPPTVPVPSLVDRSLRNAEAVLKSNELKRGTIKYKPSPFLNLVLEMYIDGELVEAGKKIAKGSTIDLVVGDGYARSTFDAPQLVGYDLEDARFIILGSNLEVGLVTVEGDTAGRKSIVFKQQPESGDRVRIGDIINVWIAPESDTLRLGGDDDDAQALLND
ncbi:PASTA domain-containing protein [Fulvivirga sp. RKSG066]|uniref:PASTA domain-containing protein n=1 Tax=Fulvivirga aurantia TaxID=2529383 RepID=UPI0012BC2AAD|nr:PASTA domain-containing protein [Fulvivirga aurantia]MTI21530.1 PASTA domain-containing protein [Fulvivirga aurantia]